MKRKDPRTQDNLATEPHGITRTNVEVRVHIRSRGGCSSAWGNSSLARYRGFTLLELLVVVVIIGLLASYVGPRYFGQLGKSEVTTAKAQMQAFSRALDQFRLDIGRYPTSEQGLSALVARPNNEPKWNGPYLQNAVPLDPWGKAYVYRLPGEKGEYDIFSYGKDGAPGGAGENADISLY